jgi:hypothetical protein
MSTKLTASYTRDSKRCHAYQIDTDEDARVVGTLYVKKGEQIPKELAIKLRVREIDG